MLSGIITVIGVLILIALIARAVQGDFLPRFPFFYSYVAFVLICTTVTLAIGHFAPAYHRSVFWFYFLITLLVEFAVLVEASDHIFDPYPAIRRLGRLISIGISTVFLFLYILPSFLQSRSSNMTILDLVKRTSFTKAVMIIVLLAAARHYQLRLDRNVAGILLGFSLYLGSNVINFALAEKYAPAYIRTFGIVGPLSWTVCSLVWIVALWRYEPVMPAARGRQENNGETLETLGYDLGKFNAALTRFLRK